MRAALILRAARTQLLFLLTALILMTSGQAGWSADPVPGVDDKTIRIGMMAPLTGQAAAYADAMRGINAYYTKLNDLGGIHGRRIETVMVDTACDPLTGSAALDDLLRPDPVFMLHGNACSSVALAIRDRVIAADMPWVVAFAVDDRISSPPHPNIFHAVPTTRNGGAAMMRYALSRPGTRKVAIVAHGDDWGRQGAAAAIDYLRDQRPGARALEVLLDPGAESAIPQVLRIKAEKPDFILLQLYEAETAVFVKDAYRFRLTGIPMISGLGTDIMETRDRVREIKALDSFHALHMYNGFPRDVAFDDWTVLLMVYGGPKGNLFSSLTSLQEFSAFDYAGIGSAVAVAEALRRAGPDLTRARFRDALEGLSKFDTGILSGPISFGPGKRQGVTELAAARLVRGRPKLFRAWRQPLQ